MIKRLIAFILVAGVANAQAPKQTQSDKPATAADAKAFTNKVNGDLKKLWVRSSTADWIKNTYITDDTEQNAAWANEAVMAYLSESIKDSLRYKDLQGLDKDTQRFLYLLRIASPLPAPSDEKKRAELASIAAKLEGMYGKGKWCRKDGKNCRD